MTPASSNSLGKWWKRFRGPKSAWRRRWVLCAVLLAAAWALFHSSRKSLSEKADGVIAQWQHQRLALNKPSEQKQVVRLFEELANAGDERRMAQIAPVFLQGPFSQADLHVVAQAAFRLFASWNDAPQSWRWELYRKIHANPAGHLAGTYCGLHDDPTQVRFQFQTQQSFSRLFLAGNWTPAAGRLAQFGGYQAVEMKNDGNGTWSLARSMMPSRFNHAYHGVVRTAPWPEGTALGWTSFRVSGGEPLQVHIPARKSVAPRPAAKNAAGPKSRVALIGVDGASWHALLPLIQRDGLPNWGRILRQGSVARLTVASGRFGLASLPSIHTALTGHLPGHHQTKKEYFGFSIRPSVARIWDYASHHRLRVATVGIWGTFPVERIFGAMVSEAFFFVRTVDDPTLKNVIHSPWTISFAETFGVKSKDLSKLLPFARWVKKNVHTVFPFELEQELARVLPHEPLSASADIATLSFAAYDKVIYGVSRHLLAQQPYDLLVDYLIDVDARSHFSWKEFEPADSSPSRGVQTSSTHSPGNETILHSYQQVDGYLGYLMETFDRIVVFSDHGMGSNLKGRDVPYYLPNVDKLVKVYDRGHRLNSRVGMSLVTVKKGQYRIDMQPDGQGVTPDLAKDLGRWKDFLSRAALASSGQPLFKVSDAVPSAAGLHMSLDMATFIEDFADRIRVDGREYPLSDFFDLLDLASDHMGNGILMVWGTGIRPGMRVEDAYEEDVAPTVMYLLDIPIPKSLDGKPLTAAIDEAYLAAHPVKWTDQEVRPPHSILSILRSIRWKRLLELDHD